MVDKQEVVAAYRYLLGREPENDAVVKEYLSANDWREIRDIFVSSSEYRANHMPPTPSLNAEPVDVDMHVPKRKFSRLLDHVQATWAELGQEKPHWSVLSGPEYLPDKIEHNAEHFFASGAADAERLDAAIARAGVKPRSGTCLELGCGVARVTPFLAERFDKVIALDVSRPHLNLARQRLTKLGVHNVELRELKRFQDLTALESIDAFYSILVLQHNPPPLIHAILHTVFSSMRPGGHAFFQVPIWQGGYRFRIEEYLRHVDRSERSMEMHVIPQRYLFPLFAEHGMAVIDMMDDGQSGPPFVSQQYLLEKRGRRRYWKVWGS